MDDPTSPNDLSLFLASTAHDMKNSISVLTGTLEKLLAQPQNGDRPHFEDQNGVRPHFGAYADMAHMLYQSKRLNDNLIQLLALYKRLGKPEYPFDMQPLEMQHLVDQVILAEAVLLRSKNITLETAYDPELVWHFDEDLIVGVIGHAINNAINYTRDRVRLAIAVVDGCLEVRVEDNGGGYPASMLAAGASAMSGMRCGVNFLTNSTGLGLHFSSEVAKMHKHRGRAGHLHLENGGAYGGGCFVLTLP